MHKMSVEQTSDALEISPRRVRQMLASGALPGEKVGRAWVIDGDDVQRAVASVRSAGRKWHPASAWTVLALANGEPTSASPVAQSRARKRLELGIPKLLARLSARGVVHRYYAHPAAIERLSDMSGIVLSGASAAHIHGAELMAGDCLEAYVRKPELARLVERFALDERSDRPNVLFRAVDAEVWPFRKGVNVAPVAVVAVDLLDAEDERSRRAGFALLDRQ